VLSKKRQTTGISELNFLKIKKYFIAAAVFLCCMTAFADEVKNIIFPVPFYTPETSAGIVLNDILLFKKNKQSSYSHINTFIMYTAKQQVVAGIMPSLYFDGDVYLFESKLIYSNFKRKFYGIGNGTVESSEEEYIKRSHGAAVCLSKKIIENVRFGFQYDFSDTTMQDLDKNGQLQFYDNDGILSGAGFKLSFDKRNDNMYPVKGYKLDLGYLLYNHNIGSKFDCSLIDVDFRNYIELNSGKILFSYQLYAGFINGNAPVQSLLSLGGQKFLRGFYSGRYIDKVAAAVQPEFKFRMTDSLDFVVFTGIGNVYRNLESVYISKLKIASGAGIRIKMKSNPRMNFRIDYALSNESKEFYFTLLEAF